MEIKSSTQTHRETSSPREAGLAMLRSIALPILVVAGLATLTVALDNDPITSGILAAATVAWIGVVVFRIWTAPRG